MTGLSIFPILVTIVLSAVCCFPLEAGAIGEDAIEDGVIEEGDRADYTVRGPLVNGMGLSSLKDLEGKPVLVEFWGSR